jgi:hypothetical protein
MRAKCGKSFAWKKVEDKNFLSVIFFAWEITCAARKNARDFPRENIIQCKRNRLIRVCVRCNYTIRESHRTQASDKKRVPPLSNIVSWRLIFIQGKLGDGHWKFERNREDIKCRTSIYRSWTCQQALFRSNFQKKSLCLSDAC